MNVQPRMVLLVEDEDTITVPLTEALGREGFRTETAGTLAAGLDVARRQRPDIVLLDVMLPDGSGFDLLRELRADERMPVIMLTARGDEADRIVGLEMGADDYVVKPFSPKELVARVRALFRRLDRKPETDEPLVFGALHVDHARHTVRWGDRPVRLTAKEFALLVALLEARGRVLSRQALLEEVWGYSYAEGTRTVDVHVRRLREKIPELAPSIVTVKTVGYRLSEEPQ
jgi:DNA-binding response OmpR family regulator